MVADGALLEKHAMQAAAEYTRRNVVFIVLRGERGQLGVHGSGTLWRTKSGLAAILTVKHLVTKHRSFTVGATDRHEIRLQDTSFREHPQLDLAIHVISDGVMSELALSIDALADANALPKQSPLLVSGFPEQGCFMDEDRQGPIKQMGDLTYFTSADGHDADAISISWKESETDEATAALFRKAGIKAGRHSMKKPEGVSGGAVWLWRKLDAAQVWSAAEAVKFVGVPYEFSQQAELALPVWRWRDWLRSELESH